MAASNRDRVGNALDMLATALDPFIEQVVAAKLPEGKDWTLLLAAKDSSKGITKTYSRGDLQNQLRMLTENVGKGWYPFDEYLSRAHKNLASELRDLRNKWAHNEPFSSDDTYRALDSVERLLRAVGATSEADQVRASRQTLQREMYESEIRNKARSQANLPSLESTGLPPWREVLRPHPDIESGEYAASEFAADLYLVAQRKEAEREYADPAEFFRRTYLTEGLRDLLARSVARVTGDPNATPVINLQTNFGGGKTHSMLAVWHMFSGNPVGEYPQEVQDAVAGHDLDKLGEVNRVAIVGNEIPTGQPITKSDGTQVHTLWGELAWQLGGREGYELVAEADRTATNPGALDELFTRFGPAVVLIDEWVSYARGLHSREDLCGGTFETQFTFAQTLTESVKRVPGTLLLVSIPASDVRRDADGESHDTSDLEIGGTYGREALQRLQNVVSRLAHQWRPASSQESFEIVRQRLFLKQPDSHAHIGLVAKKFREFYVQHRGEFPRETAEVDYEARIRAAYPIHPELFDRLYEDWSSLERFQRTRGVLRLMSGVVHALWQAGDKSPLIMPGSVPLDALRVRDEIAAYLEDSWKPIIDADIDGENSVPLRIDQQSPLFGKRSLTRRIARSVFLGSAPRLHSAHKGIERQRVFLGVAQPGDTVGNFGSALQMLGDRATYFYADGESYWFDLQQSLSRTARDQAEAFHDEDVWAEIVERLKVERSHHGNFASVVVAPASSAEVADSDATRLVILHPRHVRTKGSEESPAYTFVKDLVDRRGSAHREHRNSVVALAPDGQRMEELISAVRAHLAWRQIVARVGEMNLNQQQIAQAKRRNDETSRAVDQRIPTTYVWAVYPDQPDGSKPLRITTQKIDGNDKYLAVRAGNRLAKDDVLRTRTSYRNVRMDLDKHLRSRWNDGRITFGELWGYYTRYPYLARLRDRGVLEDAVRAVLTNVDIAWAGTGFALAAGYHIEQGNLTGLAVPTEDDSFGPVTDTTLLVAPHLAMAQRERERSAGDDEEGDEDETETGGTETGGGGPKPPPLPPPPPPPVTRNARYEARVSIDAAEDIESQLGAIAREVLAHLQKQQPDALDITLQVSAERLEGFSDTAVRTVSENANTLRFNQNRFEDGL